MTRFIPLVLVLSFIFAACAPSVYGSRYNSFDFVNSDTFPISGEGSWYASAEFPVRVFNLDLGDIPSTAFSSSKGETFKQTLRNTFTVNPISVPEGWNVVLEAATGIQTVADTSRSNSTRRVQWHETVALVLRMEVPAGQTSGHYPVMVELKANTGGSIEAFWDTLIESGELVQAEPITLN
ncbi:MAG: hypothetical protein KC422_21980 [Trueperaceae bacterium]|nr:hypothetical protein [Trueperaceae bacterium]